MRAHPNPDRRPKHIVADLKARGLPSDFPMSPHGSGQWRVRINGRDCYFGTLDDPNAAREQFEYDAPWIEKGLPIPDPTKADRTTLAGVLDRWMDYQQSRNESESIAPKTYDDYRRVAEFLKDNLNGSTPVEMLTPDRWTTLRSDIDKMTKSPTVASRYVTICKMPFRWAYESEIIDRPVRFGPSFKIAKRSAIRKARHKANSRIFTPEEVRKLIDAATGNMRAMLLMGINAGMTQSEVSSLLWPDIDTDLQYMDTIRNKTAAKRAAPLWQETVEALKAIPRHDGIERVFTTRHGNPYIKTHTSTDGKVYMRDNVSREFNKAADAAKLKLPKGMGFGKLRHTFRTVADSCTDTNAIKRIMGHEVGSGEVEATYIKDIAQERLQAVTDHVRDWLYVDKRRANKSK